MTSEHEKEQGKRPHPAQPLQLGAYNQSPQSAQESFQGSQHPPNEFESEPATKTFPLEELPYEIQQQIWSLADSHPRVNIPNGFLITPDSPAGRTIEVKITQFPFYQPSPPAPIVGRQPVPPGKYAYTWRLWGANPPNSFDYISRSRWEDHQRKNPHTLELRDDARWEVVRFNADRDTIYLDIESLFALSDFATPSGVAGVGGRAYGYGPSAAERRTRLLGFENIQRLAIPIPFPPDRQGLAWLKRNVLTSLINQVPGAPVDSRDLAPYPAVDARSGISMDDRFPSMQDPPVTSRYTLRDFLVRELQNIFDVRSFREMPLHTDTFIGVYKALVLNRGGAAREFFMRTPTPEDDDPGSESDGSDPGLPSPGPEPPLSGEAQGRYNELLGRFLNESNDEDDMDFSDPELEVASTVMKDGLPGPTGDPSRRQHHFSVALKVTGRRFERENNAHQALVRPAVAVNSAREDQLRVQWLRATENGDMAVAEEIEAQRTLVSNQGQLFRYTLATRLSPDIFAIFTALAEAEDSSDEFTKLMKPVAANLVRWRAHIAKQTKDWNELHAINMQAYFPDKNIWKREKV